MVDRRARSVYRHFQCIVLNIVQIIHFIHVPCQADLSAARQGRHVVAIYILGYWYAVANYYFSCVYYWCNGRFPIFYASRCRPTKLELWCHARTQVRPATPRAHRRPTANAALLTAPHMCGFLLPELSEGDGAGHRSSARGCQ